MVEIRKFTLPPTALMPNSPKPLLQYRGVFKESEVTPSNMYKVFKGNGWLGRWIFRYGSTQESHYHSAVHECMVVLSGSARIRFGVADTGGKDDGHEDGGILLDARVGDVFVLPAGLAHKTHGASPPAEFMLLSPGNGHDVGEEEMEAAMAKIQLSGFTMLGAYPRNGRDWDFAKGGDSEGRYEEVWAVPNPERDPVFGDSDTGILAEWH
ncbi:uncharacterized protein E0L32_008872 [Thyridium curvatum]|uniref:Cupin type-1 domain-containing protein n=1 Tax=Thyridium curvatum TaxID=1093900 RepID=A0A507B013_9PEZI|nr:uncharacterized protein E0L32_008872 [Thyridium curvatum]TPX09850.1 hypothetical protein E0L32_008872 [Thyridium curvatum]